MLLEVIETNYLNTRDWLFKLKNEGDEIVFVMNEPFYREHQLKYPISRPHIDTYDIGMQLMADVEEIDSKLVVTKIIQFFVP